MDNKNYKTMIHFIGKLPQEVGVACSGGVDSMAVLHFLTKEKKRKVYCCYFNHGTEHSIDTKYSLAGYCEKNNIPFIYSSYIGEQPKSNKEEQWRIQRYKFLKSFDFPVITCHHLDDQVETYLFSSFRGKAKLIPYQNDNIIRPFLITEKQDFINWCTKHKVPYWNDPSNSDNYYARNRIRNQIIPLIKEINPGINKVVKKRMGCEI